MKEYETLVLNAEERIREIESELFAEICRTIGSQSARLLQTARRLARLDVVAGLAEVAARHGYVRPELCEEDALEIRDGRHPVVEQHLGAATLRPQRYRAWNRESASASSPARTCRASPPTCGRWR